MASIKLGFSISTRTLIDGGSHITNIMPPNLSRNRISHATAFRLKATPPDVNFLNGERNLFRNSSVEITTIPEISPEMSMQIALLIQAYQANGHLKAKLNPLGIEERPIPDELDPSFYGFTEADLDREFFLNLGKISGLWPEYSSVQTLRSILSKLEFNYCGTIGYEYTHILDSEKRNWLKEKIEDACLRPCFLDKGEQQRAVLELLLRSTEFENFSATKLPSTTKKYGVEGCETLIPGVEEMFNCAAELGVESIVIGASHRGKYNLLTNILHKQFREMLNELSNNGIHPVDEDGFYNGSGDFMLMLGKSCDRTTRNGKKVHLSMVSMPSHLGAISPVVVGKTRAKQYYSNDLDRKRNMGVLIHGDGAFVGQGVVCETLNLSCLQDYTSGGTIHIIVNNQVSSTTYSKCGRSSHYCTDFVKAINAPIFHVNGDDVEAVVHVCQLAVEWRQRFHSDIVVDIVSFRRFGHNEADDPSFTQPKLYQVIQNHPSALDVYRNKLLKSGKISEDEIDKMYEEVNLILNEEFAASKDFVAQKRDSLSGAWSGFKSPTQFSHMKNTGVKLEILKNVGKAIIGMPENLQAHKAVKKIYADRAKMIEMGEGIDWGLAEALAYATLLAEGFHVRLSGLDVQRSSFLHRHAIIHDQENGENYCPLDHVIMNQKEDMFTVSNSSLSEYSVLGFEVGYSMENPNSLVLWEAQLGDFANVAQVIFDQFLSCGEAKWLRQTGLVVLLPHGYVGQGPDHSNAHLERFLQRSDDDPYIIPDMDQTFEKQIQECNWQVVNVTTPANYFHVLRRQMHRDFRKPLIVMSPKNLLHHKDCKSYLSEFDDAQGNGFKRLIEDQNNHSDLEEGIRRLILCSGKVYYELHEARKKAERKDVALCRVEQLCPFPYDLVQRELKRYPNAEIVWCGEEPMNMGAYHYIAPRLSTAMKAIGRGNIDDIKYVGRPPSAASATGFIQVHIKEQAELLQKAVQLDPINYPC